MLKGAEALSSSVQKLGAALLSDQVGGILTDQVRRGPAIGPVSVGRSK